MNYCHVKVKTVFIKAKYACKCVLYADKLTPEENQSPSGVGVIKDLMASAIDTAVDAAEDLPHF